MKKKNRSLTFSVFTVILPTAVMVMAMSGRNVMPPRPKGPCDIYAAAGCPCVAAHSTTRALYASYNGPLYQVQRESDGKTLDIGIVPPSKNDPGGYANAAAQDAFCANTVSWITKIYDQSGKGNHLVQAPPGTFKGPAKGGFNTLPIADMAPITISGHKVYGVYVIPGMGLRNNNAKGIAINDEPEGIYYVINGKHFDSGCCFDYGNSSTNGRAVGTGTMETTYYGTATAWGSGNGAGPWIMADMEAGLFSGYNAKKNDVPTIDSWQFVSAFVDGGGGNKWDLRGGNAQQGGLTTFYSGVRPGTPGSNAYYPMNKKGGILLGNGGDNGNGSAGTFYEGVMTTGYPTEATTDAVQANIVAAKYDVQRLKMSRITTFSPKSVQDVTVTFTNTTGAAANGVKLSIVDRKGWTIVNAGATGNSKTFAEPIAPNASVSATFKVESPSTADAGFLTAKVEWKNAAQAGIRIETNSQRVRNAFSVKINEVRFTTGSNSTNQFIELYNASTGDVDISNWTLISTPSEWAPVKLAKIPPGTTLKARGFYLLGLSASGLVAPARAGDDIINVRSIVGLEPGKQITVDGELRTIAKIGTPATPATTLFIPVSTGPWLTIPAGSKTVPVSNAAGFTVGQKIGIDMGGKYEVATVTSVGKAATQTNLSVPAKAGENTIKVLDNSNMTVGDALTINTGARKEIVKVKRIINVATAPARGGSSSAAGEVELAAPLKFDHMIDVDVAGPGTGISFSPATRFVHKSGDAIQALGSGITLETKLARNHEAGAPVINSEITTAGYQGSQKPNQWYGQPLLATAGSIALMNTNDLILVDGMVYGSQQSSSSANGTITSPEIATLEGDQSQGGCIVVVPSAGRGFSQATTIDQTNKSAGRFPDGYDSDDNCRNFQFQTTIALAAASPAGSSNIKVASVADFSIGQKIIIGSGINSETATISTVGTPGGTTVSINTAAGATVVPVESVGGFSAGQTITIGGASDLETAVIASVIAARRRFGNRSNANGPTDSITVATPLTLSHASGAQVSGSGITLSAPLTKNHDRGTQVAGNAPTPGEPNQYARKTQ
jgi:non-reducing end alpha-L-arabinofuranosidase